MGGYLSEFHTIKGHTTTIINEHYNKNSLLGPFTDVILEAKRVLLNEDLDKIIDLTLSSIEDCSKKIPPNNNKECKKDLDWNDDTFWNNLPNPLNNKRPFKVKKENLKKFEVNHEIIGKFQSVQKKTKEYFKTNKNPQSGNKLLQQKYFNIWLMAVKKEKEKRKAKENKIIQKEKLQKFLKNLKKFNKESTTKAKNKVEIKETIKSNLNRVKSSEKSKIVKTVVLKEPLQNRFKAQKNIIEQQKAKLEEQNKLIDELKLGIIREELSKSTEGIKNEIREIFNSCSNAVKCKIQPQLEIVATERDEFMVSTQKVPKFVQKMEERAIERARKREIILNRKHFIEERRKKMIEQSIEKKKHQDEEEKRKNLENMKERRRKELEMEKIRQANKIKYLEKLQKAADFYNKRLVRRMYETWKLYYFYYKSSEIKSTVYYETKLKKEVIKKFTDLVEVKYKKKFEVSEWLYKFKLLRNFFKLWLKMYSDGVKELQVAEDFYDFRLQNNIFKQWHRYVCTEYVLMDKQIKIAEKHYSKKILFSYFFQWKSLPTVMRLEKVKEEKKRKWRDRVWEILPDYKPPNENDF